MAEILAKMLQVPTSQRLAAGARTDMLSFEILVLSRSIPLRLLFRCETCRGVLLAWTATLTALVASAVEKGTADAHTLRFLLHALVADCPRGCATAAAVDSDHLKTWVAIALVALHLALMSAG